MLDRHGHNHSFPSANFTLKYTNTTSLWQGQNEAGGNRQVWGRPVPDCQGKAADLRNPAPASLLELQEAPRGF